MATKAKSIFDHLNAIYTNQSLDYYDTLSEVDKKTFNVYILNNAISLNMDFVPAVNEINRYLEHVPPRAVYLFYSQLLPKKKRFDKWIKKTDSGIDDELIDVIMKKFEVNRMTAIQYIRILMKTPDGKQELIDIMAGYGITYNVKELDNE